jgi:hypothetical protein
MGALLMTGSPHGIDSSREAGPLDRWQASCIALSTLCGQAADAASSDNSSSSSSSFVSVRAAVTHSVVMLPCYYYGSFVDQKKQCVRCS